MLSLKTKITYSILYLEVIAPQVVTVFTFHQNQYKVVLKYYTKKKKERKKEKRSSRCGAVVNESD